MEFKNNLPINTFWNCRSFLSDEGEEDRSLRDCRIVTESIQLFIENVDIKRFVIAPAGVGKSGLCKLVIDEKESILPKRKSYFFFHTSYGAEIVHGDCQNIESIKDQLLSHIVNMIVNHLEGYYALSHIVDLQKKITSGKTKTTSGKVSFKEISASEKIIETIEVIQTSYDEQYNQLNAFLQSKGKKVVVCIDNLDYVTLRLSIPEKEAVMTAFYDTVKYITNKCDSIYPILFVRDDLYRHINRHGEGNKRSNEITLQWKRGEINRFILKRFFKIPGINDFIRNSHRKYLPDFGRLFGRKKDIISFVDSLGDQGVEEWLYSFFPEKIANEYTDQEEVKFFDWLYSILQDASGVVAPRTVMKFINSYLTNSYNAAHQEGLSFFPKDERCHFRIGDNLITLAALRDAQDHMISDLASHILVKDFNKSYQGKIDSGQMRKDNEKLIKYIIYCAKDGFVDTLKIDPKSFSFQKKEFHTFLDELEFFGFFKAKNGECPHTIYELSPLMKKYVRQKIVISA